MHVPVSGGSAILASHRLFVDWLFAVQKCRSQKSPSGRCSTVYAGYPKILTFIFNIAPEYILIILGKIASRYEIWAIVCAELTKSP